MIDLVRRKHHGDGWLVFAEVGDKPGMFRDRIADGLALGVWASKRYEAHLYEFKEHRSDLKKELHDYKKAEGVGKWCHYWWLAIRDPKLIEGLAIPDVWGIVTPEVRGGVEMFKVIRKAPNLEPEPFGPMFAVSLLRNMAKKWTPTHELEALKKQVTAKVTADLEHNAKYSKDAALNDYRKLARDIRRFEEISGVKISETPRYENDDALDEDGKPLPWSMNDWQLAKIAKAVRIVLEARDARGLRGSFDDVEAEELIRREIVQVDREIDARTRLLASQQGQRAELERMLAQARAERQTAAVDPDGPSPGADRDLSTPLVP